jgi:hypothetical protein
MEPALRVLNDLERDGVVSRYAIGGAVGAVFYMEPFLTYDLDVFVQLEQTSGGLLTLSPIYEALKRRGYVEDGECVIVEGIPVQFLPAYNALLGEALAEAREIPYGMVTTRVLRPEHLVAIMVQTGRGKDRQRFSAFVLESEMDPGYLQSVLERHHLTEIFASWMTGS